MLRDGPIPRAIHGMIEYVAGVLFIAAPFVFGYDDGFAVGISIAVGVLILVMASATVGPTSLINSIPATVHAAVDYALAVFLIAAPFIFGFNDEGAPTAFFIVLGVAHLLVTIGTAFKEPSSTT
ncbi:MAG: hypothetical protein H0V67_03435 [Geodermatophilaceae bacterium]|nr:hypothetical protein [Geodermatophilaceae bacterium]